MKTELCDSEIMVNGGSRVRVKQGCTTLTKEIKVLSLEKESKVLKVQWTVEKLLSLSFKDGAGKSFIALYRPENFKLVLRMECETLFDYDFLRRASTN